MAFDKLSKFVKCHTSKKQNGAVSKGYFVFNVWDVGSSPTFGVYSTLVAQLVEQYSKPLTDLLPVFHKSEYSLTFVKK